MAMTTTEFDEVARDVYLTGVAQTLSVEKSSMTIGSVTEKTSRRRLLASTIEVETIATVPSDMAMATAAFATFEHLNRAFTSSSVSVGAVSSRRVVAQVGPVVHYTTDPTPRQPYDASSTITVSVLCAIIAAALFVVACVYRFGRCRKAGPADTRYTPQGIGRPRSLSLDQSSLQVAGFVENMHNTAAMRRSLGERPVLANNGYGGGV